jgi:predicted metal-binding membrane protein
VRAALEAHPERLALGGVALAWAWMLGEAVAARRLSCCGPHPSSAEDALAWIAMVVAMMIPMTIGSQRSVAARSYRVRRVRAVLAYVLGYLAPWLLLGALFVALRLLPFAHERRAATVLCLIAAGWALLPARERWSGLCHRLIVLCPAGPRADLDALRQGAVNGAPCVATCWPLMLACAVTGHDLVLMAGGMALAAIEKRMFRFDRRPLVLGALALAAWTLVR